MASRPPLAVVLALGFPLVSLALLKSGLFPPVWLGLPNAVFAVGLLLGFLVEGGAIVRVAAGLLGMGLCLAGVALWPGRAVALFPVLLNLLVGRLFQATLRPGSEPLITRIARIARSESEPLADELVAYTRRLTAAWAVFFLALAVNSLLLARFVSTETVLLFANSLNYLLMALFFVGENFYRRRRYPGYRHTTLLQLMGTLMRHGWLIRESAAESDVRHPEHRT